VLLISQIFTFSANREAEPCLDRQAVHFPGSVHRTNHIFKPAIIESLLRLEATGEVADENQDETRRPERRKTVLSF
jgi:hypothetical protein